MTGKQLKEFANKLQDDSIVEIYITEEKYQWNDTFRIRGTQYVEPDDN